MPVDPKKFKKIVTNHFDNLTEEEFLKTLQKSSPYIFDKNSKREHNVQLSNKYLVLAHIMVAIFEYLARKITKVLTKKA
jgi:hypothetical protein